MATPSAVPTRPGPGHADRYRGSGRDSSTAPARSGSGDADHDRSTLPAGSDAVVMIEHSQAAGEGRVHLDDQPRPEQNILRRGREMRAGEVVLKTGQMLRPQEIGLLASVGRSEVRVFLPPSVAILPTGDELVDVAEKPAAGQIRNSNGAMLLAQARRPEPMPG